MEIPKRSDIALISLVLIITVAALMVAGCLESAPVQQDPVATASQATSDHPAAATAVATRTTTAPSPLKTVQAASTSFSSTGVITIDSISAKNTGEKFTINGTTSLPAGTNLLWQIFPDTGTPPTGLDGNSMMSVGGNNLVTKGDGTSNRISIAVDLGRLVPGKYVAIVGKMKGEFKDFQIEDNAFTCFTLK
jgi:hypothetical protein